VIDAERFLKENSELIKNKSLEGCPSALAWLPEQSAIWKHMEVRWTAHGSYVGEGEKHGVRLKQF
jgi:hypothetical protein